MILIKHIFSTILLFIAVVTLLTAQQKPNVILVITDDQGYGDLGFYGNKVIKTPNLDRLFEESVTASNFHVSPTCAPTRGALMTGRYADRVGTWHTIAGRSLLFEDEKIIPQVFSENGYATGMFGKWHLGDNYPFRAEDRGFQEVVRHGGGGITQGPDYWGNDYFDDTYWHNGQPQQYKGYCTDVFFDEAERFIKKHQGELFFAYIATNAPHGPLHVPEEYYNMYKDTDGILELQKRFYGMITNIDDNIGGLVTLLDSLEIEDNTILIYMSDNGTAAGYMNRDGQSFGYNAGMRGTKGSEYDGGHRVPFAIRWPSKGIEKEEIGELLAHIDVLPTLIDLAHLRNVDSKPFDGVSFASLLRGQAKKLEHRTIITDSQRTRNLVKWRKSAVMDGDWRLIDGNKLYDISEDQGQTKDLSDQFPEVLGRLRESYNTWWTSLNEQGVNEKYAHIKVGTSFEIPTRISSHDMFIYPQSYAWNQYGALQAAKGRGVLKVEVVNGGRYKIGLRRYPRECNLAINEVVPEIPETIEISNPMPSSINVALSSAELYIADWSESKPIENSAQEIFFEGFLPAGKFDMTAYFTDENECVYPSYYTYVERVD